MRLVNWGYTKHRLKVIYQGGAIHTFWSYSFSYNQERNTMWWEPVRVTNRPVHIGVDHIAAVYQIGISYGMFGKKP